VNWSHLPPTLGYIRTNDDSRETRAAHFFQSQYLFYP
jgi:hypothetical protein